MQPSSPLHTQNLGKGSSLLLQLHPDEHEGAAPEHQRAHKPQRRRTSTCPRRQPCPDPASFHDFLCFSQKQRGAPFSPDLITRLRETHRSTTLARVWLKHRSDQEERAGPLGKKGATGGKASSYQDKPQTSLGRRLTTDKRRGFSAEDAVLYLSCRGGCCLRRLQRGTRPISEGQGG